MLRIYSGGQGMYDSRVAMLNDLRVEKIVQTEEREIH